MAGKNAAKANSGTKFVRPEGAVSEGGQQLTFIKPAELNKLGKTGIIVEGLFVGTMPNQYDENKPSYKIEQEDGSIIVLNSGGNLKARMTGIETGTLVQVSYNGMAKLTKGKFAGKDVHQFEVLVAE